MRLLAAAVIACAAMPITAQQPEFKSGVEHPVNVLPSLIGDPGGELYSTGTTQEAVDAARAFVEDLRLQYTLGYAAAKSPDGTYRTVKVEVNKPGVSVRHRGGYLALPGKN